MTLFFPRSRRTSNQKYYFNYLGGGRFYYSIYHSLLYAILVYPMGTTYG